MSRLFVRLVSLLLLIQETGICSQKSAFETCWPSMWRYLGHCNAMSKTIFFLTFPTTLPVRSCPLWSAPDLCGPTKFARPYHGLSVYLHSVGSTSSQGSPLPPYEDTNTMHR